MKSTYQTGGELHFHVNSKESTYNCIPAPSNRSPKWRVGKGPVTGFHWRPVKSVLVYNYTYTPHKSMTFVTKTPLGRRFEGPWLGKTGRTGTILSMHGQPESPGRSRWGAWVGGMDEQNRT